MVCVGRVPYTTWRREHRTTWHHRRAVNTNESWTRGNMGKYCLMQGKKIANHSFCCERELEQLWSARYHTKSYMKDMRKDLDKARSKLEEKHRESYKLRERVEKWKPWWCQAFRTLSLLQRGTGKGLGKTPLSRQTIASVRLHTIFLPAPRCVYLYLLYT